ncbi:transposable element Tcb2 transposase [Trichonephila clavipes]|nr:transposable element Tcb2 transposase [Trichonephila clavipes]
MVVKVTMKREMSFICPQDVKNPGGILFHFREGFEHCWSVKLLRTQSLPFRQQCRVHVLLSSMVVRLVLYLPTFSFLKTFNRLKRQDLNRFLETGSAGRRPGQGRRRATTPNEDRYLVLTARRHRNKNTILLQQHLRSATGTTVSTQTVRNRLHGVGLYARQPMACVRLTSRHHRDRS